MDLNLDTPSSLLFPSLRHPPETLSPRLSAMLNNEKGGSSSQSLSRKEKFFILLLCSYSKKANEQTKTDVTKRWFYNNEIKSENKIQRPNIKRTAGVLLDFEIHYSESQRTMTITTYIVKEFVIHNILTDHCSKRSLRGGWSKHKCPQHSSESL